MLALFMLMDQATLGWWGLLLKTEEEHVGGGRGGGPLIAPAKFVRWGNQIIWERQREAGG